MSDLFSASSAWTLISHRHQYLLGINLANSLIGLSLKDVDTKVQIERLNSDIPKKSKQCTQLHQAL